MTVRQPVGIALALATGVALGYAGSPSAQVVPIAPGPPTPYQQITLRLEPVYQNRVSLTVTAGETMTFIGRKIDLSIDQSHVIVPPIGVRSFGQVYELRRR
jgi:hypothetical protein